MAGFQIDAIVLRQKGHELYCFGMNSARLREICYVTPRSEEDPTEVQRILDPKRARDIGEYIKQANSLLPNALVVSLTDSVKVLPSGNDDVRVLSFPERQGRFGYILDGQHRLEGFKYTDGIEFDLPVIALHNISDDLRGKIFADINSKQVRVTDVQLLSLYYQIRQLKPDATQVMDVVIRLNADKDSPLKSRIKMMDTDKRIWVRNAALKQWLSPHLTTGGELATRPAAEQAQVMKEYFRAVSQSWPDAWGDTRNYNLCRPLGLETMLGVFGPIKHRVDLNAGRQYTAENFRSQMDPLRTASIDFPGGGKLALDWKRGPMGFLANRAARTLVIRQLSDQIRRADDPAQDIGEPAGGP